MATKAQAKKASKTKVKVRDLKAAKNVKGGGTWSSVSNAEDIAMARRSK